MPKITLAKKAEILAEVRRKTTDKFHGKMQAKDMANAEAELEQDLLNLE